MKTSIVRQVSYCACILLVAVLVLGLDGFNAYALVVQDNKLSQEAAPARDSEIVPIIQVAKDGVIGRNTSHAVSLNVDHRSGDLLAHHVGHDSPLARIQYYFSQSVRDLAVSGDWCESLNERRCKGDIAIHDFPTAPADIHQREFEPKTVHPLFVLFNDKSKVPQFDSGSELRDKTPVHQFSLLSNGFQRVANNPNLASTDCDEQEIEKPIVSAASMFLYDGKPLDYDGIAYAIGFLLSLGLIASGLSRVSGGARASGIGLVGAGLLLDVVTAVCGWLDCLPWRGCL